MCGVFHFLCPTSYRVLILSSQNIALHLADLLKISKWETGSVCSPDRRI